MDSAFPPPAAPSGAPQDVRVAAGGPHSLLVTWRAPDSKLTHGVLRGYTLALRRQNLQGHLSYITRPVTAAPGQEWSGQRERERERE